MKYLVTAGEMKEYDKNTIEKIGIPGMVLMERAALSACQLLKEQFSETDKERIKVLVLAGMGNNGGDGLALARLLCEEGFRTTVWCVGSQEKASEQWKCQRAILQNYPVKICNEAPMEEYTIMIDALFGVGLSRELSGEFQKAVEYCNAGKAFILSLDIPSGICSDTGRILGCAVKADMTVTFGVAKRGLFLYPGCEYTGELHTADIGIGSVSFFGNNPKMFYYEEDSKNLLPKRDASGNKGTFGKVLLIAGSKNMAGAAYLAAKSAYRVGAGMVKVLSPEENREILQKSIPDAMFGTYKDLVSSLEWADVVAIGPGLSQDKEAKAVLSQTIVNCTRPLIIDADGLNILASDATMQEALAKQGMEGRTIILTPHVGELSRLLKVPVSTLKEALWDYGEKLAEKLQCVVVAKDARTFTCKKGKPVCINIKGNSGMAVAGCGDVLCGVIAGLFAQNKNSFDAASIGVYIHAIAGDKAAILRGEHGMMASDVVACL